MAKWFCERKSIRKRRENDIKKDKSAFTASVEFVQHASLLQIKLFKERKAEQ